MTEEERSRKTQEMLIEIEKRKAAKAAVKGSAPPPPNAPKEMSSKPPVGPAEERQRKADAKRRLAEFPPPKVTFDPESDEDSIYIAKAKGKRAAADDPAASIARELAQASQTPVTAREDEDEETVEEDEETPHGAPEPPQKPKDKKISSASAEANKATAKNRGEMARARMAKQVARAEKVGKSVQAVDNTLYLSHAMEIANLPAVDWQDPDSVAERAGEYFDICIKDNMRPTYVGVALAFGMSKQTLDQVRKGARKLNTPPECLEIIEKAVTIVNEQMESYMMNNAVQSVSGIFLMKNDFGYKDNTDHSVTVTSTEVTPEALVAEASKLPDIDMDEADILEDENTVTIEAQEEAAASQPPESQQEEDEA